MFRRLDNEFEYTLRKDTREYREYQEILARPNELPNLFTEIDDDWHVEC